MARASDTPANADATSLTSLPLLFGYEKKAAYVRCPALVFASAHYGDLVCLLGGRMTLASHCDESDANLHARATRACRSVTPCAESG